MTLTCQVDGVDLRDASHEEAVEAIRRAGNPVSFLVQSIIQKPRVGLKVENVSNMAVSNQNGRLSMTFRALVFKTLFVAYQMSCCKQKIADFLCLFSDCFMRICGGKIFTTGSFLKGATKMTLHGRRMPKWPTCCQSIPWHHFWVLLPLAQLRMMIGKPFTGCLLMK